MKNPTYSKKSIQCILSVDYSMQIVNAYRPIISQQIERSLKKIAQAVIADNLQAGMLHLFFGETIANGYNHGNSHYYESYYAQISTVLAKWLSLQLLETDNTLFGELFTKTTHAAKTVQEHVTKLSALGVPSPLVTHTAFFPAVYPAPFRGIIYGLKASYSPCPKMTADSTTQADSVHSLLVWALERSKQRMLVSLHDASDFDTLQELQATRHTEHQLNILDALTQGYEDTFFRSPADVNTFTPSAAIQTKINYEGIRFCSYETFLHLSDSKSLENIPFAATNILNQLNSDYLHHGLTLSAKELALFLKLHHSTLSSELMITEESAEAFYKTALGRSILQRYVSDDQLQHIVRHHTMLNTEKNERKE